jgi:N,N'-diacetyllegionaminate synthase
MATREIRIGNKIVGEGHACFIIAEAGVNHNGEVELAKRLIEAARNAGADAVKFQTFHTEKIVTRHAQKATYQKERTGHGESQFEMIKKLELNEEDFRELAGYAEKTGIIFLSTPFDEESADFLGNLHMAAFKIASGEITNLPFLRHVAKKGKPILLSTGMSTMGDVEDALSALRSQGCKEIVLLHCVSSYPARPKDVNLRAMRSLQCAFKLPVGFSDHTIGIVASLAATAMGACIVEKHFTLDKNFPGPDHRASLDPAELMEMVQGIRCVEQLLGDGIKRPTPEEEETKMAVRKSLVAGIDLPAGTRIARGMLEVKRPGTGIEPKHFDAVIGMKTRTDMKKDEILNWYKLE